MREDLQYAINREWFGSPKDCVPKSALQQILDANKPKKYGVLGNVEGFKGQIIPCETIQEIKTLVNEGFRIYAIFNKEELEQVVAKLC